MRQAHVHFLGGPLDGRVLPVAVNLAERVPKEYRVPVPAHGDIPAEVLVYAREEVRGTDGRRRWRYTYVSPKTAPGTGTGDGSD